MIPVEEVLYATATEVPQGRALHMVFKAPVANHSYTKKIMW